MKIDRESWHVTFYIVYTNGKNYTSYHNRCDNEGEVDELIRNKTEELFSKIPIESITITDLYKFVEYIPIKSSIVVYKRKEINERD